MTKLSKEAPRKKTTGFTLIELLVVIAIIAILAAILFPVFLAAQKTARQSQCLDNCLQLSKACLIYADDYSGHGVNDIVWGKDTYTSRIQDSPMWKYLKSGVRGGQVTCCPCDSRKNPDNPTGPLRQWSITYNNYLSAGTGWGPPGGVDGTVYAWFQNPAKLPMWICESASRTETSTPVNDTNFCNTDVVSTRHNGYGCVSFLDGHAGRLKGRLEWNAARYSDGTFIFHPLH